MIESREILSSDGLSEVIVVQRIAGYAAPLEPGTVDPVQAQILAAVRAVERGQVLVRESGGALVLVERDYEQDMFDDEGMSTGVADTTPPSIAVAEPPAHVVLAHELALVDEPGSFDEWEAEVFGDEPHEGAPWDGPHEGTPWNEPVHEQVAAPIAGTAEVVDEPGVRVPRRLPVGLGELPGGVELAQVLESVQLRAIGAYELVEFVAACQRMSSAMDALQASAVSELTRRVEMRPAEGVRTESMTTGRITTLEVGARLMTSDDDAGRLVSRAAVVCEQLPDTFTLWRSGVLPTEKVDVLVTKLARVDPELARAVEARVLPGAKKRTSQSLRRQITRLLHKLAPKAAKKRHEESRAERFVRITPAPDGMAWLEAYLSAEDAAAAKAVLDAGAATLKRHDDAFGAATYEPGAAATGSAATTGQPESGSAAGSGHAGSGGGAGHDGHAQQRRTASNRRADVLAALAWAALDEGRIGGCRNTAAAWPTGGFGLSSVHGRAVAVNVTIPLTSLLGETDEPGELAGHGPITAHTARRLAVQGTWRRILTDPRSGAVLDVGRTRYAPPRDLADHVMVRDQRCVWPTCDRPASGTGIQLDHTVAFDDGGVTAHTNLGVMCGKNHVDKHQAGWTVSQPESGRFVFLSPTGHVYATELEMVGSTAEEATNTAAKDVAHAAADGPAMGGRPASMVGADESPPF